MFDFRPLISFCLQIFPTRYLRCSSAVTVGVLKKFLIMKFAIPETHSVRVNILIWQFKCLKVTRWNGQMQNTQQSNKQKNNSRLRGNSVLLLGNAVCSKRKCWTTKQEQRQEQITTMTTIAVRHCQQQQQLAPSIGQEVRVWSRVTVNSIRQRVLGPALTVRFMEVSVLNIVQLQ